MGFLKTVNTKYLVSPKLLYFFINLQYYTLHQFRGIFAKEKFGISNSDLGKYLGTLLCITFFTNIFIASMNDKFKKPKFFIVGLLVMSSLVFQLFFWDSLMGMTQLLFWSNLMIYLTFNTSLPALLDKVTLDLLNKTPGAGPKAYGKQRMWGTFGYTLSTFLIEKIVRIDGVYHFDNLRYYSIITTTAAAGMAFFFIKNSNDNERTQRNDILAGMASLLKNTEYMYFIFIIFLNAITRASVSIYLTIYMSEVLMIKPYPLPSSWPNWIQWIVNIFNKSPISTTVTCGTILEVVVLFFSQQINTKIGLLWPLMIAQVFQVVRILGYYFLDHTNSNAFAYCCLFEFAKGVYFGLTHTSAVQLATNLCPSHLKSTSQMIYQGTFTALGSVAAGLIFGSLFSKDKMSGTADVAQKASSFNTFFLVNTAFALATLVLFTSKYFVYDRIFKSQDPLKLEKNINAQKIANK